MANKFFKEDIEDDDKVPEDESEYSDKIKIFPNKSEDEYFNRNSTATRIILIALGSFCAIGIIYYVMEWLSTK